jgi:hypothetical protein
VKQNRFRLDAARKGFETAGAKMEDFISSLASTIWWPSLKLPMMRRVRKRTPDEFATEPYAQAIRQFLHSMKHKYGEVV